jgi:Ca2+/Na+ antiporter
MQGPAQSIADTADSPDDIRAISAVVGGILASAASVAGLGSAVMWIRLYHLDVASGPTVAMMPAHLRVVIGARHLAVSLAIALVAIVVFIGLGGARPASQQ